MPKKIFTALCCFAFHVSAFAATGAPTKEMKDVLDALGSLKPKPIVTLSAPEARKQPSPADGMKLVMKNKGIKPDMTGLEKVYDHSLATPTGSLAARIYKPKGENLPVTVYYHGGGWVIADLDTYHASAYALAKKSNTIVVSVEYRKGPENKFPAAHDDAFAAYKWATKNAKSIGGDATRLAVAGESAGGNLAVNVAIRARDEKLQAPYAVIAVYPIAGSDTNTESYKENAAAKPLDKPMMEWFFKQYAGGKDIAKDPRINLVAANLKGLPPTTIVLAEIDPLRTEGEQLGKALEKAGVSVRSHLYKGVTHEFFGMADYVPEAREAQDFAVAGLKASGNTKTP